MLLTVRRPVRTARPTAGLTIYLTLKSFNAPRSITLRLTALSRNSGITPDNGLDSDFKDDVEALLRENAELLRRLAK
jgi:hypothetical protein